MECLFCKIANKESEATILYEDDLVMAILDVFPNVDGHTLIIPKKHYDTYNDIPDDLLLHINKVAKEQSKILLNKLQKNSLTLLVNYGDAQVIKHYHLHLLPNYGKEKKANSSLDDIKKIIGV